VAGDRDEFVPASSSLTPFGQQTHAVVPGNHTQIVSPADDNSLSYKLMAAILEGGDASGFADAAAIAVELGEFQKAISTLLPHADELDDQHVVLLSLALESVGRSEEALDMLESRDDDGTDAVGVLAGRLKRRWMTEGRAADGARSLELYGGALSAALGNSDSQQAFYHAINAAFLTWAYDQDQEGAKALAQTALDQANTEPDAPWAAATAGEAHLYLGDTDKALEDYRRAVARGHGPRELQSMHQQAAWAARLVDDTDTEEAIDRLFTARG
jgi:tetratricopeptide (TPR) repeat protein